MGEPRLHVVLFQPEIPPNTGNVGRLCLGVGARLHLVHPIGFSLDQKAVRRAGLDYWRHVDLHEHADPAAFQAWARGRRLFLYSTRGGRRYTEALHREGDVLVFGCESRGLPRSMVEEAGAWRLPLRSERVRSLNLSNAVAVVVYHALERIEPGWE